MLALGPLRAGSPPPLQYRNAELVIMRVRSACDNVRLPGVKSGLLRSLTTADHRSR